MAFDAPPDGYTSDVPPDGYAESSGSTSLSDRLFGIEKQQGLPSGPMEVIKQAIENYKNAALSPMPGSILTAPIAATQRTAQQAGSDVARSLIAKGHTLLTSRLGGMGTQMALDPTTYFSGGVGGTVGKDIAQEGVDAAGPSIMKTMTDTPEAATRTFLDNPSAVKAASGSDSAIESAVNDVQTSLNQVVKDMGATLDKAKSSIGIPTTVAEREASIVKYGNPHGLGSDVVNKATQTMLDSSTPEELAANIAQFKSQLAGGTSDPSLTARVANALQDKVNNFVDWHKTGTITEGVLKQQYKDLGNIIANHTDDLQGAKADMSGALDIFKDLKTHLADVSKEGKAEQFLRNLFTSSAPKYKDYLSSLTDLEKMTGKPLIKPLFTQFAARAMNKLIGRPGIAAVAAGEIPTSLAYAHPLGALVGAAGLVGQSPRIMSRVLQYAPAVAGAGAAIPSAAAPTGLQILRNHINKQRVPQ